MVLQSWSALKHPFSLSVFEVGAFQLTQFIHQLLQELLYWTDWDVEGVLAVNKFTGGDPKTVCHSLLIISLTVKRVLYRVRQKYALFFQSSKFILIVNIFPKQ
jgi:hypothetical protein